MSALGQASGEIRTTFPLRNRPMLCSPTTIFANPS